MDVKTLEQIEAEVGRLIEADKSLHDEYLKKYEDAKSNAEMAMIQAKKAFSDADTKAYHKAQNDARFESDSADMFKRKADEVEKTPAISKDEYGKYISAISGCLDAMTATETDRLKKVLDELTDIYSTYESVYLRGNAIAKDIQEQLLKVVTGNSDVYTKIDGVQVMTMAKRVRIDTPTVHSTVGDLLRHPFICELLGADNPAVEKQIVRW